MGDDLHALEEFIEVASDYLFKRNESTIAPNWHKSLEDLTGCFDSRKCVLTSDWVVESDCDRQRKV
jgi:hypothetical protein